jgi:hypothetical protein
MGPIGEPDAVGDNLIEMKAELGRSAAQRVHKLGIKEGLTPCEAKNAYAIGMGILQEAHRRRDRQPILPLNRDAAVWTGQVALVGAGEGKIVGTESSRTAAHGPFGGIRAERRARSAERDRLLALRARRSHAEAEKMTT